MCARWPYGGGWSRNIRSTFIMNGYPFLSRLIFLPFRLQPPHCHFSALASARYCTQSRSSTSILRASPRDCRMAVAQKRVRDLRGFSPTGLAESSSLTLRTGISPQVALHLSSRKRSYHCRIQGGNVTLVGTCTQLIKRLRRRTRRHIPCADTKSQAHSMCRSQNKQTHPNSTAKSFDKLLDSSQVRSDVRLEDCVVIAIGKLHQPFLI